MILGSDGGMSSQPAQYLSLGPNFVQQHNEQIQESQFFFFIVSSYPWKWKNLIDSLIP